MLLLLGSRQVEETTYDDFDMVVLLEHPVSSSGVKTLGLTLLGYTWQWQRFYTVTMLMALLGVCSDMNFRVKTHDLAFEGWIRRWRHLCVVPFLKALLLKNLSHCPCVVKR